MKVIRYNETWFDVGPSGTSEAKFVKGQVYPISNETKRHVEHGIAEEIDAPEDVDKAVAAAEKAAAAAVKAAEAADSARDTAALAQAAAEIKA